MGPKKKKKVAVPHTRGFATTSIVKPKVDPPPAEAEVKGEITQDTADFPHSAITGAVDSVDNPPNATDEAAEWEKTSTTLPALLGVADVNTMVRTAALKVDMDMAKDQRRRKEISRDNTIPTMKLAYKLETDIQQFLTTGDTIKEDGMCRQPHLSISFLHRDCTSPAAEFGIINFPFISTVSHCLSHAPGG